MRVEPVDLHPRAVACWYIRRRALLREVVGAQVIPYARKHMIHDEPEHAQDDERRGIGGDMEVRRQLADDLCINQFSGRVSTSAGSWPPRHRRDACSMVWRCRFLTARSSQDGRVIAEK